MAAVAIVAQPRFWVAGALLAVALFGQHEPAHEIVPEHARLIAPPAVVIQLQPRSDLATLELETNDQMNIGVGPLASWISHLLQNLTGDAG
jgi:hypothetical protein